MRLPLIFVGVAVAAVAAGFAVAMTKKSWLKASDRLWIIGDSLSVGLLPRLVSKGKNSGVYVAGNVKGGTTIQYWNQQLSDANKLDTLSDGMTHVLIILGSNDADASEDYVTTTAPHEAHSLVARLQSKGLHVAWLAPGDTGALKYSKEIRTMIRAASWADGFYEFEVPEWIEYSPDRIHPSTPTGYDHLAGEIWDRLTKY